MMVAGGMANVVGGCTLLPTNWDTLQERFIVMDVSFCDAVFIALWWKRASYVNLVAYMYLCLCIDSCASFNVSNLNWHNKKIYILSHNFKVLHYLSILVNCNRDLVLYKFNSSSFGGHKFCIET